MKKFFFTLLVAALSFASCDNKTATPAAEGEAAAPEAVTGGDIAYVRVEYVLAESEIYKTEGVALQEKTQKAQNSWAQKEQNLQYEATQLQEKYQKGLITTADAQKQQESIERLLGVTKFPTFMLFDKNGKHRLSTRRTSYSLTAHRI